MTRSLDLLPAGGDQKLLNKLLYKPILYGTRFVRWGLLPSPEVTTSTNEVTLGKHRITGDGYLHHANDGGHFDAELCLRAWLDGRYTCGLYYGRVGNGVGGHKTRVGAQARLRRRNQHTAIADLRAKWAVHNATIAQRLNAENGQLLAFARRGDGALRLQRARRESQESCGGKKG